MLKLAHIIDNASDDYIVRSLWPEEPVGALYPRLCRMWLHQMAEFETKKIQNSDDVPSVQQENVGILVREFEDSLGKFF